RAAEGEGAGAGFLERAWAARGAGERAAVSDMQDKVVLRDGARAGEVEDSGVAVPEHEAGAGGDVHRGVVGEQVGREQGERAGLDEDGVAAERSADADGAVAEQRALAE